MENSGLGATEFDIRRVIPGPAEEVRLRLAAVLEEFNYRVLNEQPIQARRAQLKNVWTANSLEVSAKLTIALKQVSPSATLATFDYAAQYIFTEGDVKTFESEVDAIIALALATARPMVCASCGVESTSDSRFCRACGAPADRETLPAELEVMRLTANARAAHQEHILGLVILLLNLAITLPMILFGSPKALNAGIVLLVIGQNIAWFFLLFGSYRLHRALNPGDRTSEDAPLRSPQAIPGGRARALPPKSAWASVTEGTTELLGASREEKTAVPRERDTANVD